MKKGISAILAGSMAVSMFASLASAATTTMTTQQRYEMLEEAGIFTGFEDGTARLNERMTRAQFARVAVLLLDLDLTAPPATATFRDVPKGHWAFEEVEAAVDAGIISGVGNGLFNPNANVTIQEMARVLVDALDIDTEANATVEGTVAAWAVPYVAAAVKAGLIPATTNYTAAATRAQLVDAAAVAYDAVMGANITTVTATDKGTLTVVLNEEVDAATAADFTVTQSIGGAAATTVTPSAVVLGADKKTVTITIPAVAATNADQSVVVNVSYKGKTAVAAQAFTVAGSLKVAEVKALNAKQIQVTFNRDVDGTAAANAANYSVSTAAGAIAGGFTVGVVDARNVILTAANPIVTTGNTAQVAVTVKDVTQAGAPDIKVPFYSMTITVADTTAPAIASVSSVTNAATTNSVTVNFSEPVQSAVFRVNGTAVVSAVPANASNMSYTITTGAALNTTGAHTLDVIQLTDAAGNSTSVSQSFTITRDVTAPTVTITTQSDNQLVLTFSKAMNKTAVETVGAVTVRDELLNAVGVTSVVAADATNTKFIVNIADQLYTNGRTSRTLNVVFTDAVVDYLGNKLGAQTRQATIAKDTTAPTITGATINRNAAGLVTGITLTLSEGAKGTINPANIFVLDANGVNVSPTFLVQAAIAVDAGSTSVTIPVQGAPVALTGTRTLQIPAGFVTENSQANNTTAASTQVLNFGTGAAAATSFALTQAQITSTNNANNDITITFNDVVKGGNVAGSATDINNYTINGAALPAGTTLFLDASRKVLSINLPNNDVITTSDATAIFRVTNVQTEGGATVTPFTGTVAVVDNTRPTLQSARVLSSTSLELTYSENLTAINAAAAADEYAITVGGAAFAAGTVTATSAAGIGNRIILNLQNPMNLAGGDIAVSTVAGNGDVKDAANNAHKPGVTVTASR